MAGCSLYGAVTTGLLPWFSNFPIMMALRFAAMGFCGGLDAAINAELFSTWTSSSDQSMFLYILHAMYPFGAIASPVVTEQFMAQPEELSAVAGPFPALDLKRNDCLNTTIVHTTENTSVSDSINLSLSSTNLSLLPDVSSIKIAMDTDTHVQYAFLVTACTNICIAIPFIVLYCMPEKASEVKIQSKTDTQESRQEHIEGKRKILVIVLVIVVFALYHSINDTYYGYLMTYCLSQLHWSKYEGSLATSFYWAALGFGRILAMFCLPYINMSKTLMLSVIVTILSFVLFLIGSVYILTVLLWFSVVAIGLSMSITFPTLFAWMEEKITHITGKMASLILIACSLGSMINPLFLGYLMENLTPLWFVYLLLGQCVGELIMLILAFVLVGLKHSKPKYERLFTPN